ncbi:MAG: hypothetical protein KBG82_08690 [Spirochaetes bacterium]|nr:hypothetical protein [Spirochaetota bacterium]
MVVNTSTTELKFTGNWFIDAGILGFVNLMEEVYGWDLDEIERIIRDEPINVYYGYFPFGYLYKWVSDKSVNQTPQVKSDLVKQIENKLKSQKFGDKDKEKLFDDVWYSFICPLFEDLWVEDKAKLSYEKALYRRNKLNKRFECSNSQEYLSKISKRDNLLNDILNRYPKEVKAILKKKDLKEFKYDDLKNLIDKYNKGEVNSPPELRNSIRLLDQANSDLKTFLQKDWNANVVNKKEFDQIREKFSLFYRIPIDSGFYKNFLFFNNSLGNLEQRDSFYNLISFNSADEEILEKMDKTINKFLPSEKEFSNISYAELSTESFKNNIEYLFVYLLCFIYAFEYYKNLGYILFYSNDLDFSYIVNKKIRLGNKKIGLDKGRKQRSIQKNGILRLTWKQIIDTLVERKSSWSLENMYIISYQKLDNKTQEGVEYIGIPKLQASILLDDTIRKELNSWIQFRSQKFGGKSHCWLLEEFIKGKPLYPIILNHINLVLNQGENVFFNRTSSRYSLIVEAKILEFKAKHSTNNLFSSEYFDNYKALVGEIKNEAKSSLFYAGFINQISADENIRRNMGTELLETLKAKNKITFLNILLKNINESSNIGAIESFMDWIFNKIIVNNVSWEMYALLLIVNLTSNSK